MKLFRLPPWLLLAVFTYTDLIAASPAPPYERSGPNTTAALATTGSGPKYASACQSAISSYESASSSWDKIHNYISYRTEFLGGTTWSGFTVWENATTLCDGHGRVTYSPAIYITDGTSTFTGPITATTTITESYGQMFPEPSPTCSIQPSDCDLLWIEYSKSRTSAATITPAPNIVTPHCMNQTEESSWKASSEYLHGCGKCTIFGEGVELVYFPTTASRDMCASTPTASPTHYGKGAVITVYAGTQYQGPGAANGSSTAVVDRHTFTSGTAYLSISKVYAIDRCNKTFGPTVTDAILAMPSESVLSLRYSQLRYQRWVATDKVTGYPLSYADFNTPIPWSAWNGQNQCEGPRDNFFCGVIYENSFRPQLAIPPEITSLSPHFEDCQMWYNGLWDPPLRLTKYATAAKPTLPNAPGQTSAPASPSSPAPAPTVAPTALPNELPTSNGAGSPPASPPDETSLPAENSPSSENDPSVPSPGPHNGPSLPNIAPTGTDSSPTQDGSNDNGAGPAPNGGFDFAPSGHVHTAIIFMGGQAEPVVYSYDGGPIVIGATVTLTPGGPEATLHGQVISAVTGGIVLGSSTTVGVDAGVTDDANTSGTETAEVSGNGRTPTSSRSGSGGAAGTSAAGTGQNGDSSTGAASKFAEGVNIAAVFAIFVAVAVV